MNTKKLMDSITHLSDSYLEEALDMRPTGSSTKTGLWVSHSRLKPVLIGAAAVLCIGIGILYMIHNGLPGFHPSSGSAEQSTETPKAKDSFFSPLKVIAYAAETTNDTSEQGTELEEDVPITLSKYSVAMSNVPAMPFSFSYDEKEADDEIHFLVSADYMGILQKYQVNGGEWELTEEAESLECLPNEKIYWCPNTPFEAPKLETSPEDKEPEKPNLRKDDDALLCFESTPPEDSDEDNIILLPEDLGTDSVITVQVYSGTKLLETRYIGISYDDLYYTATLKLNISRDSEDFGDYTIESKLYETSDHVTHEKILEKLEEKLEQRGGAKGGQKGEPVSNGTEDEDIEIQDE